VKRSIRQAIRGISLMLSENVIQLSLEDVAVNIVVDIFEQ
jgi:hypothetical protein